MKAKVRALIVVVASALLAQLAVSSTAEAAGRKSARHQKHHKHTIRELPPDDAIGPLRTR